MDVVVAFVLGASISAMLLGNLLPTPQSNDFDVVCTYLGGQVQGDVCVGNGKVIRTRDEVNKVIDQ